jgi:hypothetical protein
MEGNAIISIFVVPFFACVCGIAPLIFATILYLNARKRSGVKSYLEQAKPLRAGYASEGIGPVWVRGTIEKVLNGIIPGDEPPTALLRLHIEALTQKMDDDGQEWTTQADQMRVMPFVLADPSGSLWVDPTGVAKSLLGTPITPISELLNKAVLALQINPGAAYGSRKMRYQLWQLKQGEAVTVIGTVQQRKESPVLAGTHEQPIIISPLEIHQVLALTTKQAKTSNIWAYILGIPGILFLIISLITFISAIFKVVSAGR